MKQKFTSVNNQLSEIALRLQEHKQKRNPAGMFRIFMLQLVQLSLTSARLHRNQAENVAALTDSHHGKISRILLSPSQVQDELVPVRNHFPTSLELPVSKDNILQRYKIMNVRKYRIK